MCFINKCIHTPGRRVRDHHRNIDSRGFHFFYDAKVLLEKEVISIFKLSLFGSTLLYIPTTDILKAKETHNIHKTPTTVISENELWDVAKRYQICVKRCLILVFQA